MTARTRAGTITRSSALHGGTPEPAHDEGRRDHSRRPSCVSGGCAAYRRQNQPEMRSHSQSMMPPMMPPARLTVTVAVASSPSA